MNLLIVRRPGEAEDLSRAFLEKKRPGAQCTDYTEHSTREVFRYSLTRLRWTPQPAPNAIVYPFTGALSEDTQSVAMYLDEVARLATRDNCTLFVLVPRLESAEQEKFVRSQEDWLFQRVPTAFVLHGLDLSLNPAGLADLVVKLTESGMFGRYTVATIGKTLTIKPLLKRVPLFVPAETTA